MKITVVDEPRDRASLVVEMNSRISFRMGGPTQDETGHLVCGYAHFKLKKAPCCKNVILFVVMEDALGEKVDLQSVMPELHRHVTGDLYSRQHLADLLGPPQYYIRLHECNDELQPMKCGVFVYGNNASCQTCPRVGVMPSRKQLDSLVEEPEPFVEAVPVCATDVLMQFSDGGTDSE